MVSNAALNHRLPLCAEQVLGEKRTRAEEVQKQLVLEIRIQWRLQRGLRGGATAEAHQNQTIAREWLSARYVPSSGIETKHFRFSLLHAS